MQATISFIHSIAETSNKKFKHLSASLKGVLSNETYQKVILFSGILGLLLLAANLEKFV